MDGRTDIPGSAAGLGTGFTGAPFILTGLKLVLVAADVISSVILDADQSLIKGLLSGRL